MLATSQLLTAWHTTANLTLSSPPVQRPLIKHVRANLDRSTAMSVTDRSNELGAQHGQLAPPVPSSLAFSSVPVPVAAHLRVHTRDSQNRADHRGKVRIVASWVYTF